MALESARATINETAYGKLLARALPRVVKTEEENERMIAELEKLDTRGRPLTPEEESLAEPDLTDRASLETERAIELRTRDRERKLISKIDAALTRIEDGSYGYCEETDEPISLRRLDARPIATLSLEAQERHERMERTHRDD